MREAPDRQLCTRRRRDAPRAAQFLGDLVQRCRARDADKAFPLIAADRRSLLSGLKVTRRGRHAHVVRIAEPTLRDVVPLEPARLFTGSPEALCRNDHRRILAHRPTRLADLAPGPAIYSEAATVKDSAGLPRICRTSEKRNRKGATCGRSAIRRTSASFATLT
jgi:hypothetical protein